MTQTPNTRLTPLIKSVTAMGQPLQTITEARNTDAGASSTGCHGALGALLCSEHCSLVPTAKQGHHPKVPRCEAQSRQQGDLSRDVVSRGRCSLCKAPWGGTGAGEIGAGRHGGGEEGRLTSCSSTGGLRAPTAGAAGRFPCKSRYTHHAYW